MTKTLAIAVVHAMNWSSQADSMTMHFLCSKTVKISTAVIK